MNSDAGKTQNPSIRELRQFGLSTGILVAVLFGALIPWMRDLSYPLWPWIMMAILAFWALSAPKTLAPVHRIWMRFALLISKVTIPVFLGIVFFLVFVPLGLIYRVFGRDTMHRDFEPDQPTYRVGTDKKSVESLEKPY